MWKRMRHPNVVAFIGVTRTPMQFVSEWMHNGTLAEYLDKNPGADRICLVSFPFMVTDRPVTLFPVAIGCSRRAHLSSCKLHNTRRLEWGKFLPWIVLGGINNI